jgi:hypothetical protein
VVPLVCYQLLYHETNIDAIYWIALPVFCRVGESYFAYYLPYIMMVVSILLMAACYQPKVVGNASKRCSKGRSLCMSPLRKLYFAEKVAENSAQPLPSHVGEGLGVGSVLFSLIRSYRPHPLPLPFLRPDGSKRAELERKGGEGLRHRFQLKGGSEWTHHIEHSISEMSRRSQIGITLRLLLVLLLSQAVAAAMGATPGVRLVVNELMQSNIDCVMDDLNEFPDSWVELYNDGSAAAKLNRYSLGITPNADEAWPLPDKTVAAGGHILIYCDKVGDGLHAPFRLETNKDFALYLFCNGQLIDQVDGLKKQPAPNIAYGRETDGSAEWGYQLTPTPGSPNSGEVCDHDHILGLPVFSEPGRVVTNDTSFRLVLSVPEGSPIGTEIRYTINGTEPTRTSTLYSAPLTISNSQVVRAKLFCQGWLSPRAVTQSYIFFPRELTLPVISIVTDIAYLNGKQTGIFANNTGEKRVNWRRPINIEFFFDGEGTPSNLNQLCETRVAGAASRGASKKSMAIYAHKRF